MKNFLQLFLLLLISAQASYALSDHSVIVSLKQQPGIHDALANVKGQGPTRAAAIAQRVSLNKGLAASHAKSLNLKAEQHFGAAFVGFSTTVTDMQLAALRADPKVLSVSDNYLMWADAGKPGSGSSGGGSSGGGSGGGSQQTVPWGIERIGATGADNKGAGIHVFVVDSGIDLDHPDLSVNEGYAVIPCNLKGQQTCSVDWDDDAGHGTHVSGIIAALNNSEGVVGVAPDAILHAVKVLDSRADTNAANVAAGMDWVTQRTLELGTVTVANVSIGGNGSRDGYCDSNGYHGSDNYFRAFCAAANAGVIIAVSAGNYATDGRNFLPTTYDDATIAVSAAWGGPASSGGDWWWDHSNWGDEAASWNPRNSAPVALGAPGYEIYSTFPLEDGGYATHTGTSMAAPHVAGAIALYLAKHAQNQNYSAFLNIRALLLGDSTNTDHFTNTSGYPHEENYLDVNAVR